MPSTSARCSRSGLGARAQAALTAFVVAGALAACGGGGDSHGHDDDAAVDTATSADVSDAAAGATDTVPAETDTLGDVPAETAAVCTPACGAGFVCCADVHGHFPKCTAGAACP